MAQATPLLRSLHFTSFRRSPAGIGPCGRARQFALLMSVLVYCCISNVAAQVTATLSGTVSDQSGAVVSGATATARNVDTGFSRSTVTNQAGFYQLFALPVGQYEVRVKKDGFAEAVRTGIRLVVGQDASADLNLHVGAVSEELKVTADAALVNVTTQDISGLVGERQVKDLPLNGRSYDLLLTLNPGIVNFTTEKTGGIGVSNSTTGNNFAVSGNRPQQNLFLLNGVEYTGAAENNMQPGGTSQELLGVDAIREFNVLRDSYGAEYGKRPGGQVIIVTQSGTNRIHGSAYEFLRNNAFDAPNYFDQGSAPPFQRNQFGGSLGGPLRSGKTFLFGNYEGCASTCIKPRRHLCPMLRRARARYQAFSLCSISGPLLRREPQTLTGSPKCSAVRCRPFARILVLLDWTTSFPRGILWQRCTRSTMATT